MSKVVVDNGGVWSDGVWSLGTGTQYVDGPGGGTFSPRLPVSTHHFGWSVAGTYFVVKSDRGIGGVSYNLLGVPVELAEAFLLRCIDPTFNRVVLCNSYPSDDFKEVIMVGNAHLTVRRAKAIINHSGPSELPSLWLDFEKIGQPNTKLSLSLFSDLRTSFGKRMHRYTPKQVQRNLRVRTQIIAAHS